MELSTEEVKEILSTPKTCGRQFIYKRYQTDYIQWVIEREKLHNECTLCDYFCEKAKHNKLDT